jgi:hypothetical protein
MYINKVRLQDRVLNVKMVVRFNYHFALETSRMRDHSVTQKSQAKLQFYTSETW